jgi:flagellin-like protein
MKKFRKSRKALSPVVASIILIAVTVAVSIAVAAWMGALSIGFMATEQISITNCQFTETGTDLHDTITLTVSNTGTSNVEITSATVNGVNADLTAPVTVLANSEGTDVVVEYGWTSAYSYQIRLMSSKGNYFPYNAVAP